MALREAAQEVTYDLVKIYKLIPKVCLSRYLKLIYQWAWTVWTLNVVE